MPTSIGSEREVTRALPLGLAEGSQGNVAVAALMWAATLAAWRGRRGWLTGLLLAAASAAFALVLYFFRDPEREPPAEEGIAVSPGDGVIVASVIEHEPEYLGAPARRISIFLSIMDVHVQRAPVAGRVVAWEHRPGEFLQAFRPEASERNEHIAMLLETEHGPVLVKQIAGIMARRCVNTTRVGDNLDRGQRIGLIRFGSRVDLFLPPNVEMIAAIGDRVAGGVTPLARFARG